ncbi:AMP-binding enzyme [Dictyocaulus viviparus]|uniref:Very long-chain fatty acid transport protein n=1 Tax=Dictyocaulus viviparus TaxID=29172 RepID=A0A0D8XM81_DICVI|nr:AMP-binding enzyme [Dictyocaulus viviparus]
MALAASPNPLQPRHNSKAVEAGILEKSASLLPSLRHEELITLIFIVTAVFFKSLPIGVVLGFVLSIYIAVVYGDFIYRSYLTLNRDLSGLFLILDIKFDLWKKLRENKGLHEIFLDVVKKNPDKTAMIDIETGRIFSFEAFNKECNRYANFFQGKGFRAGDVVALFMENSVDFVAAWMGLAKIGIATAWINCNLKREPLAHCIQTSRAKAIITTRLLQETLDETINAGLFSCHNTTLYVIGQTQNDSRFILLSDELQSQRTTEPRKCDVIDFKSILCYIYTSGTTGLPKAAVMKHFRYYSMVIGAAKSFGIYSSDRIYVSMPIYHTAAGILGIGQALCRGSCCVIRKKFSASNFWKDCVRYQCTASQYIGEICRYLLAQPVVPEEANHHMRLLYGNGLRAEIWQPFVDRFRVKIGEVYGSTEGTSNLVNIDGHVGACGFLPISPLTKKMHPVRLIRVDDRTGEVVRSESGLCIACNPGESGAMVSTIRKDNPLLQFEGYLNKSETNKKIIRDVFTKGDSCFVSGDLLYWDRLGYVYFKDRTGDTFRWKGENVSTTEVEAILHPEKGVADATVYGITIPRREGRAGMAAIVRKYDSDCSDEEFIEKIGSRLAASLAPYALPQFIRLCKDVDLTGTFKLVKTNLQRLGYKLDKPDNKVYIYNAKLRNYERLTEERVNDLEHGTYPL